ncbi:MAG: 2-phospho-L-lactate guanylyltransferase [Betaproteobacteria bacterium]|nr:2-phospho-L-lactate guanylyltransferase [Betaproteobacteria bacterium]
MTRGRDIVAVVPVKGSIEAKSRLGPDYPVEFRCGLAQAMLEDVLTALRAAQELAGLVVVTVDPPARATAARFGARVLEDGARDGHTGAVVAAGRRLAAEGRAGMLTVPGDIPLITADEVACLFAAHGEAPAFSIVPAHDRRGSNAILMTPPDAVPLAFGNDSFLPHLDAARQLGIEPAIVPLPGIGLDIDNGPDLALLMRTPSPTRTWAFLAARGLVAPFASRSRVAQ